MTSLESSSLNSNESLNPHFLRSIPSTLIRVLSHWVNAQLGQQVILHFETDFKNGLYLEQLVNHFLLLNAQPLLSSNCYENDHHNNGKSLDHLYHVPQIITILFENYESSTQLITEIVSAITHGSMEITLELLSCIALKLLMKPALLDTHGTFLTTQVNVDTSSFLHLSLPTFQIYQLSFQHTFLQVRCSLLSWINNRFNHIDNKLDDATCILDFGPSWKSGLAFALLIQSQNPSFLPDDLQLWINQQKLHHSREKWTFIKDLNQTSTLLSLIFTLANQHMNIPIYLYPQDLLETDSPNEWSIMLYVYEYYKCASQQSQQPQQSTSTVLVPESHLLQAMITIQLPSHPLDDPDTTSIDLYTQHVSKVRSLWSTYMEERSLTQPTHQQQMVMASMEEMNQAYDLFNQGIRFAEIGQAIQNELLVVETMMNNTDSTMTIESIQQLEARLSMVQSSLYGMEEEFSVLTRQQQSRYTDYLHQMDERYKIVCSWVDQVRVWMIEADRIRERISQWIELVQHRNATTSDNLQVNALNVIDLGIMDDHLNAMTLYNEHEQLKREIDHFEAEDMKRLRAHVKQRTVEQQKNMQQRDDLTPADTSIIEITLITLNMLHRLRQLVNDRGYWIDCLVHRLKWEHMFDNAVKWIFAKDAELDDFLRDQAIWCEQQDYDDGLNSSTKSTKLSDSATDLSSSLSVSPSNNDNTSKQIAERIINSLIQIEQDISVFDRGEFTTVLEACQEMEGLVHSDDADGGGGGLPTYLEQRQNGFEAAFEDLMKRCGLARNVVEQHLVMMDIVAQFKVIKTNGENLRKRLLADNDGLDASFDDDNVDDADDDDDDHNKNDDTNDGNDNITIDNNDNDSNNSIETCARKFKDISAGFVTHAKTRIPYPEPPVMMTALGAKDSQIVDLTNDTIQSTLQTYGMSLALIADGLDQLLVDRQHVHSLQRRAKHACEQLMRFTDWMNDRQRLIEKSNFDIYNHDEIDSNNDNIPFTTQSVEDKEDELIRLEKERDSIASRLQQMEHDELAKLLDSVDTLESDIDDANAVSVDRHALVDAIQRLDDARTTLNTLLSERTLKLDALKKHLAWRMQWIRTHQWILSTTRKLWDFCVKKAKYDPGAPDNVDSPVPTDYRDLTTTLRSYQDRITDAGERQMAGLAEMYTTMVDGVNDWIVTTKSVTINTVEESIHQQTRHDIFTGKQSMVVQKYRTLVHLSQYASKLVDQRSMMTDILIHIQDAAHEGERLRDNLTKSTRRMMEQDVVHQQDSHQKDQQQEQVLQNRVASFQGLITKIKKSSQALIYPLFTPKSNDPSYCTIFMSPQLQQIQQSNIKNVLVDKMTYLENLENLLIQLLAAYEKAERKKQLVMQYSADALELDQWIQEQISTLQKRHLDVAAETMDAFLLDGKRSWEKLKQQHQQLAAAIDIFESNKLKALHDKVALLMEDKHTKGQSRPPIQQEQQQRHRSSVDMTISVSQSVGLVITNFSILKQDLNDESITIDAILKRMEWNDGLMVALSQLENIQERLALWCKKKDDWISSGTVFDGDAGDDQDDDDQDDDDDDDDDDTEFSPMLEILYNDLAKLTTDKELFTATILPKVQDLYDTFIQYFPKLPRPMATPDHIEGAMSSLVRSNSRCQEMLVSKNKELDIIQDCIRWEATWRLLFQMIKDCQFKLEDFVLRFARWRPPTDSTIHRINDLSLQQQSSAIRQQCEEKTNQLCDLHVQLDSLCNDVSTNNVSNIITKLLLAKFNQAEYHSRHVILLIHFMDLVMKQNEMVQALWCRITRVDNDLSSLLLKNRETSNDSSYDHDKEENDDISRVYSISNDQHAQLSKDVDQIRLDISDMIYPVRPLLQNGYHGDGSSDDDHDDSNNNNNNGVALDDIDNNTIRETLKNGLDQLDQRVLELGRLLLVNNKRSLRQASVQSFKQQLRSCLDLLNGLKSKLEIVISSLECPLPQVESDSDGSAFETRISTLETSLDSTHGVLETLEFNKNLLSELSRIHDQFFGDIWLVNESTSKTIDDDNDDDGNGDDQLEPTYKYILKEWDDIQSTSSRINSQIKDKDLPDMLQRGVEKLLDQLQELDNIPLIVHYSSISKDQFTLWMAKLEYARQMYTYLRPRINHEKVSILKSQLDDANNKIVRIDGSLSMMEKKIEQWQLFSKHEIKIKAFVDQVMKMEQQLKDLQQIFDTMDYTTSSGNNSDDALQDDDNYRRGKTQQRQITENIQSFKSVYMDLCNFFIQQQQIQIANNYHDDFLSSRMKSQQDQMESAWSNLQRTATATAQRISMMDRWRDIYINLQDSRRTLYGCKTTLEMIMLQKSNTSIDRPITDMTRTTTLIDTVKRQLASILPWLKDLPEQLDNDLLYNNDYHYGLFFGYHQETLNLASLVQQLLKDHYLATEGKHLFQIYQDTIDERWQDCIKQCTLLKQYEQNYQQYHGPQGDSNSIIISNLHAMLENHASVEDIKRRMMIYRDEVFSDTGDMKLLGDRLAIEFGYNDELKDLQHKLSSSLTALDNAILFDEKRYQFMMAVERYANQTTEILGTLTEFHHVISSLQEIGHSSEGDNDFAEVLERYRKLEETMLEQTSFDTQQHGDDGDDNELRVAWVTWLDQLHQEIGKKWNLCMDAMEIVQKQQHIDHQKKQLGTKLDGLLRYVNDMKDQVNALHLLEYQNITVEHQELDDIENEFHDTLCAKIDSLLDLTKEGDKAMIGDDIQQLRTSLRQAADDLRSIIQRKRQDAERQDRAMQMMNHLDKLEQVINHMEDDIARAAPHHARIINDAFVKSDLQDLRTELVKSYKACSQKMASLFDKIPHDTTLAATTNLLTEAKQRWTKTKEKAVARERELQTCIEQLQHDFFTKLAIVSKKQQQQKNTIRSSFIFPTTSSPSTSYQVDKENSLDIQVGRVLKDQPYRPKVKMVPGQVGKYWIGSVHPRLVYCRILKSKVVMVRVGGGWVELSQFLLDHGCNEGVVISDVPPLEKNARFNEAYIPFSSRSLSPSGRVVLRGGGGVLKYGNDSMGSLSPSRSSSKTSTNTRCRSPLTGYTDGERYVRVDEAGNHLALKMTRAEDDYFIPFYQMK